jgi:hypothetical protein
MPLIGHVYRRDVELTQDDLQLDAVVLAQRLIQIREWLVDEEECASGRYSGRGRRAAFRHRTASSSCDPRIRELQSQARWSSGIWRWPAQPVPALPPEQEVRPRVRTGAQMRVEAHSAEKPYRHAGHPCGTCFRSMFSYRTSPESAISLAIVFRSVVLPHPLGPGASVVLPSGILRFSCRMANVTPSTTMNWRRERPVRTHECRGPTQADLGASCRRRSDQSAS